MTRLIFGGLEFLFTVAWNRKKNATEGVFGCQAKKYYGNGPQERIMIIILSLKCKLTMTFCVASYR